MPAPWQEVATTLPPGTFVEVRLADGTHVKGTLLEVSLTAVRLQVKTRRTTRLRAVPADEVRSIQMRTPGRSAGMKALKVAAWTGAVIGTISLFHLLHYLNCECG